MQPVHVLSMVLTLQSHAAAAGAPVRACVARTMQALCAELERVPEQVLPDVRAERDAPEKRPRSAFDPEPHDALMEASRCRALLLEVVRRAAHDWVLYRGSRRPERVFAKEAYVWLFEEKPGHPDWEARQLDGEPLFAFLTICECLDLDPEMVRRRVRKMTMRDIMMAGRPAETRKLKYDGVEDYVAPSELEMYPFEELGITSYEAQFAIGTC